MFDGDASLVKIVTPAFTAPTTARGPANDQALAAPADLVVSDDAHPLDLVASHGIEIVTTARAMVCIDADAEEVPASTNGASEASCRASLPVALTD